MQMILVMVAWSSLMGGLFVGIGFQAWLVEPFAITGACLFFAYTLTVIQHWCWKRGWWLTPSRGKK
ncbi:MAG: hypothetical protein SWN10_13600 [Pseudomonadota bacterium]|nr:hypothetical protein [Pseudomonadota bacterium]